MADRQTEPVSRAGLFTYQVVYADSVVLVAGDKAITGEKRTREVNADYFKTTRAGVLCFYKQPQSEGVGSTLRR